MKQAVVAIVENDSGEVLVGKKVVKAGHPMSGKWHFPGGTVEGQEDLSKALLREILEETNLGISPFKELGTKRRYEHELHYYACKIVSGEPMAGDDLCEIQFVSKQSALKLLHINSHASGGWPDEVFEFLRT